jgi:hypothetical protein
MLYLATTRSTYSILSTEIKLYYQNVSDDLYEDLLQEQANLSPRRIELSLDKIKQV